MTLDQPIRLGMLVRALKRIVEGDAEPCAYALECEDGWIHAEPGDVGKIVYIDSKLLLPTVHFSRTGTSTLVFHEEIEPLTDDELEALRANIDILK